MKIKVNKHKLNIHYRGSPWGSRTQQHAYCLRYAHSQHIESHLGKKQQQAKIPIAFLFSQLHFNNFTSHALFYGGHLVMRSKRCAMQNQGITLICGRRFYDKNGSVKAFAALLHHFHHKMVLLRLPCMSSRLKLLEDSFLDYIANIIVSITNSSNLIGSQQLLFTA